MSWAARRQYLAAKAERTRLEHYAMDLLWLLAKRNYEDLPQPSKIAAGRPVRDTRSGQQILDDTRAALLKRIERMKQKAAQKEKR